MSPEDPNNPGLNTTNPDLSSVPLPEPSPIKSPYAPVGGTLGDVANDVAANDPSMAPQPSPVPTAGIITEDPNAPETPATPVNPSPTGSVTLGGDPVVPQADAQSAPAPAPAGQKPKGKKLPLIIGIIVALAIVGVVVFLVIAKPFGSGGGSDGKKNASGDPFYKTKSMIVSSAEKGKKYAIYSTDGDKITDFDFDDSSEYFVGGAAMMKKDGKYGIVDEEGKEIVKFGEAGKIKAYGALYGVEDNDKKKLVNNKGETVVEYEDENLDHYNDYTSGKNTAYTLFRNDKHYTVYSPYGGKVTEFDSEISPTVSTPNVGDEGAKSVIVYSGGVIVLDDKGSEVRRINKNITKKTFGVFVSKSGNIIGLSTTNVALLNSMGKIASPDDGRHNSLIMGDNYYDYDTKECPGLYYDEDYVDDDEDGFVLCIRGYDNFVITADGSLSPDTYSPSTVKGYAASIYKENAIYPITNDAYALMTKATYPTESYGIFYGGKKVVNLVSTDAQYSTDSQKKTKTKSRTSYRLLGMNDSYIVQKTEDKTITSYKDAGLTQAEKTTQSVDGALTFFNKKGEKICTFDKKGYTATTSYPNEFSPGSLFISSASSTDVTGFVNGFALVRKLQNNSFDPNGYTLINDKCEVVDEKTYYQSLSGEGDFAVLTKKEGSAYSTSLIDKDGKTVASGSSKFGSGSLTQYAAGFGMFGNGPKYFVGYGKSLKEFDHFCNFNSGIAYNGFYVELTTGTPAKGICNDDKATPGEHYYFTPNGKEFYKWSESGNNK